MPESFRYKGITYTTGDKVKCVIKCDDITDAVIKVLTPEEAAAISKNNVIIGADGIEASFVIFQNVIDGSDNFRDRYGYKYAWWANIKNGCLTDEVYRLKPASKKIKGKPKKVERIDNLALIVEEVHTRNMGMM